MELQRKLYSISVWEPYLVPQIYLTCRQVRLEGMFLERLSWLYLFEITTWNHPAENTIINVLQ